jgi:hypothetical protein
MFNLLGVSVRFSGCLVLSGVALMGIGALTPAAAQDLEPRAYAASPVGMTFVLVGVGRSSGSVFADPSLPFEDVRATLSAGSVGFGQTFDMLSRTALCFAVIPYAWGKASGRIEETTAEAHRVGWGDPRLKLSVNLVGGQAYRPREFLKAPRSTIVGVSLTAVPPMGQYHGDRLVNIGANRWVFKPEVGLSVPAGRWTFDAYGGVWLFATNEEFFPGDARREQNPIVAIQGHVGYTVRPQLWIAFDATWYSGGSTTVDGVQKRDLQRNTRMGATVSMPLKANQSIKGSFSTGTTTRIGGDFNTLAVAWQMFWFR